MNASNSIRVRVADAVAVTPSVRRLKLVPVSDSGLPEFSGGAHTIVELAGHERTARNPYSLMGSPFDVSSYEISVLRVPNSRGGSAFIHDRLQPGSELSISTPVNLFPLDRRARKHIFIAGGIGITPFMAMMSQLTKECANFELHYAMRSPQTGAYWQLLTSLYGPRVKTYFNSKGETIDLNALLDCQPLGTHLYVCGPSGMIDWVLDSARGYGWPDENLHCERFSAPEPGKAFTATLARSNLEVAVSESQSLLEAIEAAGVAAPYLCRGGACGQCETTVRSCAGAIEHHDHYLSEAEKASGKKIMPCVSRTDGSPIVLDL
ncbi:MAG: PDR/VanB family oxidoreductase [Hyphomicrobiaceae bacterium]